MLVILFHETNVIDYAYATSNKYDVSNCIISKIINMENHFKRSTYDNIKSSFLRNLKSSQRFGETSVFSKNLSVFSKKFKTFIKREEIFIFH